MFLKDNTEQVNEVANNFFDGFDDAVNVINAHNDYLVDIILTDCEYTTYGEIRYTEDFSQEIHEKYGENAKYEIKNRIYVGIIEQIGGTGLLSKKVRIHKGVEACVIIIAYTFKSLQPYQMRVVRENMDLMDKIEKLESFINSTMFSTLSDEERVLLRMQHGYMSLYAGILQKRINNF